MADDGVTLDKMEGGTDGQYITYDSSGNPTRATFPDIPAASTTNPVDVGTTTIGTDDGFARGDHAHGGGGGDGDITGITTNATGGLDGGADSGDPSLVLDITRLNSINGTNTNKDDLVHVNDISDTSDPNKNITLRELAQAIFRAETDTMNANSVSGSNDYFYIIDQDHQGGTPRRFTWNSMRDKFRIDLITDTDLDLGDTTTESTTQAASRQAVAEAIP